MAASSRDAPSDSVALNMPPVCSSDGHDRSLEESSPVDALGHGSAAFLASPLFSVRLSHHTGCVGSSGKGLDSYRK
jgi:hypothetical protein